MDYIEYLKKRKDSLQIELAKKDDLQKQYDQTLQQIRQLEDRCVGISAVYNSIDKETIYGEINLLEELIKSAECEPIKAEKEKKK